MAKAAHPFAPDNEGLLLTVKSHNSGTSQRTGAGYADRHPELGGNHFAGKTDPARAEFERARCEYNAAQLNDAHRNVSREGGDSGGAGDDFGKAARRESFMVRRQKPQPVLKPSLSLSLGPDRSAFNQQWVDERLKAKRDQRKRYRAR